MNQEVAKEILEQEVGRRHARWLDSHYTTALLAFISFTESVFAPILIDPFLVAFIMARRERWLRYVLVSIIFSVLGGVAGYFLGLLFFEFIGTKIIAFYNLTNQFADMSEKLDANGFVFVLLGALTPIPYKLVAIAGGLVQMSFVTFVFASVFGRVLRLGLVGYAAYVGGPHALPILRKHLLKFAYVTAAILIAYLIIRFLR